MTTDSTRATSAHSMAFDRRSLLGAVPAIAAAAAIPAIAFTAPTGEWEAALAHCERAYTALDAACDVSAAASSLYFEARPKLPNGTPCFVGDTLETYSARVHAEKAAREVAGRECRRRFGVDEATDAEDRACDAASAALSALLATPAPDLAAVIRKIELISEMGNDHHDHTSVISDLRRMGAN